MSILLFSSQCWPALIQLPNPNQGSRSLSPERFTDHFSASNHCLVSGPARSASGAIAKGEDNRSPAYVPTFLRSKAVHCWHYLDYRVVHLWHSWDFRAVHYWDSIGNG
eukprot:1159697-Pelagomonas_calceolata.AAC.8